MFFFLKILLMFTIFPANESTDHTSNLVSTEACSDLPPLCRYVDYRHDYSVSRNVFHKKDWLTCEPSLLLFDAEMSQKFEQFAAKCRETRTKTPPGESIRRVISSLSISIRAVSHRIVNDSFGVFDLANMLATAHDSAVNLIILNLNGFDIDSSFVADFTNTLLQFHTDFNLFEKNRLLRGCRDFFANNDSSQSRREFIFRGELNLFAIYRPQARHPVCSEFFRNAKIQLYFVYTMASSFYMKNTLTYSNPLDPVSSDLNLNSSIENVDFERVYLIDLDSKLLHSNIFASLKSFLCQGHLNSIEPNVFAPFAQLRELIFQSTGIMGVIRRQGIEWIKRINSQVRVDVTNSSEIRLHAEYLTQISFGSDRFEKFDFTSADFCLFVEFPFQQMVFMRHDVYGYYPWYGSILYPKFRFT